MVAVRCRRRKLGLSDRPQEEVSAFHSRVKFLWEEETADSDYTSCVISREELREEGVNQKLGELKGRKLGRLGRDLQPLGRKRVCRAGHDGGAPLLRGAPKPRWRMTNGEREEASTCPWPPASPFQPSCQPTRTVLDVFQGDDSDEEDLCISNKWTFQRSSRRWSRVDDLHTLFPGGDRSGSSGDVGMRNTTSSESVLTDLSEPELCSVHSESSGGSDGRGQPGGPDGPGVPDATVVSSGLPQSPKDALNYPFHPKNEKPSRARAKSFLKRMETLRGKGAHGRHKGSGRTGGLVISGPVLQQEPESFKAVQCVHMPNGDLRPSPPAACRKGLPSSSKGSGEVSPAESSGGLSAPGLKERKCQEPSKRGGMYLEDLDVLAGTALRDAGDHNHTHEFHSQENLVVHVPEDHKPGTFPKALSIESLSPTDSSGGVNWRTGSISLGRQQGPGAREPGLMASCHRASRVSIYDNVPGSHLYASTGDLLDLEKDDLGPHLDDILHHVSGLQEGVDDWSRSVLPELPTHDTLVRKPGLCPFPSSNQIALDFEGNSVSEGRTTPSDVDRDGTSLNESEAPGVRDRRDSGVGASLTRPNRLVA